MSIRYNRGRTEFAKGNIDWENDTIMVAKMATSYTPDPDAHQFLSDISAERVGTDVVLANAVVTQNDAEDSSDQNGDDMNETGQTLSTDKVVVYKSTGDPATSVLIVCNDLVDGGGNPVTISPVAGDIDLILDPRGLFSM